jgi:glutaredoxin 3
VSALEVIMYSRSSFCSFCERAKALLSHKGIPFREIDVESDPTLRQEMLTRSGRRTVPQIFIGARYVGGFEELAALDHAGELDPLLRPGTS